MIQLSGAGKRFGEKLLFEGVNWLIGPKDRVGLVGANGTGKSTLLKVLCGQDSLDAGHIVRAKGITAGYLPQEGLALSGRTLFAECASVFAGLRAMEEELGALARSMAELDPSSEEYRQAADRFHSVDTEFRPRGGYAIDAQVGTVLSGLGFPERDWLRRTEEFSGGWQMRIVLAKLLLEKPNLLLLDEPTNHLDLEARNWLEEYLASYPHACVLVSHDHYFLDVTVQKIVEIWNHRFHFYTGGYTRHLEQKAQRRAQLEAAHGRQHERIRQLEAFITRFRYKASKAKQVQSRIKELERMEKIEIPRQEETIRFSFPQPKPSGRLVAEFDNVAKSYRENPVFQNVRFVIERGDRIALVGANGAGKSTLMKLLAGIEPLTSGEYRLGHNARPDYFAQDQYRELDPDATLLDDLSAAATRWTQTELRGLLGCFLFTGEDVYKPIRVLSGGERNRYALARLLAAPSNFLLLDEPTNHLDLRAKQVLLTALENHSGTVVFVSHDRHFIDKLATRVFEVGGGRVETHAGNYEDYLWQKARRQLEVPVGIEPPPEEEASQSTAPSPKPRRLNPIRLRQLQERCKTIEEDIARAEAAVAECEQELAVFKGAEETKRLRALLGERRSELDAFLAEWEEVSRTIDFDSP